MFSPEPHDHAKRALVYHFIAMKHILPAIIVLGLIAMLFTSGCAYDGEGTGFTQKDLELQRKQAERSRGF